MKKLAIIIIFISFGITKIQTQTTLQYSVHALKAGIDNPMSYCKYADPGMAGKEQSWNFSNLEFEKPFTGFIKISDYTDYQKAFPYSNTVLAEFNSLFYLNVTPDQVDQYGYISTDGRSKISYSVPFVKMKFPFAYGDIYSGSVIGTYEESGIITGNISGTYTVEADGYGKLILPNNSIFENVLRIRTYKTYDNHLANTTQHVEIITYRWYNAIHRYPLLVLTEFKTSTGESESVNYQAAYNSDAIHIPGLSSFPVSEADFSLFPNPAISSLNLSFSSPVSGNMNVEIFGSDGRLVNIFNQEFLEGTHNYNLSKEISGLLPGSYILVFNNGNSRITKDFTLAE